MTEITTGIRRMLSHPKVYNAFQLLMGAHNSRRSYVQQCIKPFPGMKILDIGCGPADILSYLPQYVDYWGFDINRSYIDYAKSKYSARGYFSEKSLNHTDLVKLPEFDTVLAIGLLHHLDNQKAHFIIRSAYKSLKPGGKLLTVDPCIDPSQSRIARFIVQRDRGQNIRDKSGYKALVQECFQDLHVVVRHKSWIPYTHCYMQCTK